MYNKPITSSYIYSQYGPNLGPTIQRIITEGKVLSQQDLEEQFIMIKKYCNSAFKPRILSELQNGSIKLLYAPDDVSKVTSLPYVFSKSDGRLVVNVIVSAYGNMRQDGAVSIDFRKLYTLMESAYVGKQFMERYDKYKNNSSIINGCVLYANMFVKPINKKFNLHLDKNRENAVIFLAAKFYLKNVLGLQNEEIIYNTAMKACKAPNPILLKEADLVVGDEAYTDLGTFIEALKQDKLNLGLNGLTGRGFMNDFLSSYGQSTAFGLELMPYFLFIVNAATTSMNIVNNYSLETIMEKGGPKIISQFLI